MRNLYTIMRGLNTWNKLERRFEIQTTELDIFSWWRVRSRVTHIHNWYLKRLDSSQLKNWWGNCGLVEVIQNFPCSLSGQHVAQRWLLCTTGRNANPERKFQTRSWPSDRSWTQRWENIVASEAWTRLASFGINGEQARAWINLDPCKKLHQWRRHNYICPSGAH